jgi:hypothetical protein
MFQVIEERENDLRCQPGISKQAARSRLKSQFVISKHDRDEGATLSSAQGSALALCPPFLTL